MSKNPCVGLSSMTGTLNFNMLDLVCRENPEVVS
jgi:hypothetical protein